MTYSVSAFIARYCGRTTGAFCCNICLLAERCVEHTVRITATVDSVVGIGLSCISYDGIT